MTIWRMCIANCIPKAKNIHSEYVILIAFPLQQWLYERTPMLRYTYIACLVKNLFFSVLPAADNLAVFFFKTYRTLEKTSCVSEFCILFSSMQ